MYVSSHVVTGAAVGKLAAGNFPGFILGIISHVLLDLIPHHDYKKTWGMVLDILITIVMFSWILSFHPAYIFWGALGGALPDLEVFLNRTVFKEKKISIFPTHNGLLPHGKMEWPVGFLIPVLIGLLGLIFLQMG